MDIHSISILGIFAGLALVSIALAVLWVLCLIHAAQEENYGWFVAMIVFGVVAIPYFFLEYEWPGEQRERRRYQRAS